MTTTRSGELRIVEKSTKWYARIDGRDVPLHRDKAVSQQVKATLEADALRAGVGIGPKNPQLAKKPQLEHVEDFYQHLLTKGITVKHAQYAKSSLVRIFAALDWNRLNQLDSSEAAEYIAELGRSEEPMQLPIADLRPGEVARLLGISLTALNQSICRYSLEGGHGEGKARRLPRNTILALAAKRCLGIGPRTRNELRIRLKHFGRWLEESGRVNRNPFQHGLDAENESTDNRHRRDALSNKELSQLLASTQSAPDALDSLAASADCCTL